LSPPPGPAPSSCAPYEDCNGPLLNGDPLLDRPGTPPPGWFAGVEANIVSAHVKNHLVGSATVDLTPLGQGPGFATNQIFLPTAELDWVGSPRVEVGYRFAQGFGEVALAYQSLVTSGNTVVSNFDIDGSDGLIHSRLNLNAVDLDYGSNEYSLGPRWQFKWLAGVRFASIYFDSVGVGPFLEQQTSNDFRGAGPHLGLELARSLGCSCLSLYTRLEISGLIGEIKQRFAETITFPDGSTTSGESILRDTQFVPDLRFQIGLSWAPPGTVHWLRFTGGYEIENWWYLGELDPSRAELTVQGAFFRAEFEF
jgi:hypothetical protein